MNEPHPQSNRKLDPRTFAAQRLVNLNGGAMLPEVPWWDPEDLHLALDAWLHVNAFIAKQMPPRLDGIVFSTRRPESKNSPDRAAPKPQESRLIPNPERWTVFRSALAPVVERVVETFAWPSHSWTLAISA